MRKIDEQIAYLRWAQANYPPLNVLVDFGGVVVQRRMPAEGGGWTEMPRDRYYLSPEIPGSIRYLRRLGQAIGPEHILMCKGLPDNCTPEIRELIESQLHKWIGLHRFLERTQIPEKNIVFAKRSQKAKMSLNQVNGYWVALEDRGEAARKIKNYVLKVELIIVNPANEEWEQFAPPPTEWEPTFAESAREWFEAIVHLRRRQVKSAETLGTI